MTAHKAFFARCLAIVLGAVLLAWPLFVNGGPFFIADTSAYIRSADSGMAVLTGHRTIWSDRTDWYIGKGAAKAASPAPTPAAPQPSPQTPTVGTPTHPPLLGRSIYYGLAIYYPVVLFGENAVPLFQALLLAILLWITVRAAMRFPRDSASVIAPFALTCVGVAFLTSASFVTTLVVPDVLSGMALVAATLLILFARQFTRGEALFLAAIMIWGSMAHTSHFLILAALLPVAAFLAWRKAGSWVAVGLIGLAMALTVAGDKAYVAAVRHSIGQDPLRPPFLSARLIDDGPGYETLNAICPDPAFDLCSYRDRMPRDSDAFLWSLSPKDGIFSATSHEVQRRVAAQDFAFAVTTFRHFPVQVVTGGLSAAARQATLYNLAMYHGAPPHAGVPTLIDNLPLPVARHMRQTRAANGVMPVSWVSAASLIAAIASLVAFALSFRRRRPAADTWGRTWTTAALLVIYGVAVNAAITGALSKPDPRYNARIVWVLPVIIGAALYQGRRKRRALDL